MGQGSSRVPGYKESQANNVLSHVSHGDLTTVAIVGSRVLLSISSDPSSNVFSADPFLHVYFSPASTTRPDVVETNSPTKVDRPIHQPGGAKLDRVISPMFAHLTLAPLTWTFREWELIPSFFSSVTGPWFRWV